LVQVERARPDDFLVLEALVEATFIETWTGIVDEEHIRQHMFDGHASQVVERYRHCSNADIFVARLADALVGYAIGLSAEDDAAAYVPGFYKVDKLYLKASLHGQGVGKQLWDAIVGSAIGSGAAGLYLTHYPGNARASRFYARQGLRKVGDTVYKCGNGDYSDWVLAAYWNELGFASDDRGVIAK
jgi:ribosomal protein S18 acetylase RimI-like enzyme